MTRPWLTEKFCHDPNPHGPHKWPIPDLDEDSRFWCKGVQNVQVKPGLLDVQDIPHGLRHTPYRDGDRLFCTRCNASRRLSG